MISSGLHFGMHIEEEETSRFSSILSSVFDVSTETRSGICVCVCFFFLLLSAFLFPLVFLFFFLFFYFPILFCHSFPLCFAAFHCFLSAFSSHDVSVRLAEAGDSAALFGLLKAYLVQEKLMYVVPLITLFHFPHLFFNTHRILKINNGIPTMFRLQFWLHCKQVCLLFIHQHKCFKTCSFMCVFIL